MIAAAIENAIIERLKAASTAGLLGYAWRTVDSLPTDLDERLAEYIKALPAAWVIWNGWRKASDHGDGTSRIEHQLTVVVAAANLRNERAQRHGAGGDVGAYQLVADATALLMGQRFGLPIGPLVPGDCRPLYTAAEQGKRRAALYAIGFTAAGEIAPMSWPLIATPEIGEFETFDVAWDLPPAAGSREAADFHQLIKPQDD